MYVVAIVGKKTKQHPCSKKYRPKLGSQEAKKFNIIEFRVGLDRKLDLPKQIKDRGNEAVGSLSFNY